jgi:anion-transporting  ArsA/GET3 family ATPase
VSPKLAGLVRHADVLLCAGTGGVGKTTTAAALAVAAARAGRRAVVVTIDPARRLADALGLEALTNEPTPVIGDWPGELHAMMLDARQTFDDLVARYAEDAQQATSILENRLYQNLSGRLSGTQEYMAVEKLFELHETGDYDLIVVDTPPTRNALDFLEAPDRLARFLDGRLVRLLFPSSVRRIVNASLQLILNRAARVVGRQVVDDTIAFLRAFQGMEDGFRDRARHVRTLLADPGTGVLLVTAPRADLVDETRYFAQRVTEAGLTVEGLIVNRTNPGFGAGPADQLEVLAGHYAGLPIEPLLRVLAEAEALTEAEQAACDPIVDAIAPAPVVRVPLLDEDVHDLAGVELIAGHLTGSTP